MPSDSVAPTLVAHIDGGSRGNPGPSAYGVVIETDDGSPVAYFSEFLGHTTNNFAEYQALLAALEYVLEHHHPRLKVLSDSELLVRQIRGSYRVKSLDLKPLHARALRMIAQLESFSISYIPREQNREADQLVNQALDRKEQRTPKPTRAPSASSSRDLLRARATFHQGRLELDRELPLFDGEVVEVEIRRKP